MLLPKISDSLAVVGRYLACDESYISQCLYVYWYELGWLLMYCVGQFILTLMLVFMLPHVEDFTVPWGVVLTIMLLAMDQETYGVGASIKNTHHG